MLGLLLRDVHALESSRPRCRTVLLPLLELALMSIYPLLDLLEVEEGLVQALLQQILPHSLHFK